MVAIPVLTLVPGVVGGSETYVRELLRALARVGTHEYRVLTPPVARDAGDGLPTCTAEGYGGHRLLAMARGAVSPRYHCNITTEADQPIPRSRFAAILLGRLHSSTKPLARLWSNASPVSYVARS